MRHKKAKVVYTAVFGDYDAISPVDPNWGCDFICFTDNPEVVSTGWIVKLVKIHNEGAQYTNRRLKILAHEYLKDYAESLYIDGNIEIIRDPEPLFDKYLKDKYLIAIPAHSDRNCADRKSVV